ncbi:MAG: geranylgeranyl pyrophosphate synthase [Crocinitomicaceae bacterium]|jgi:geranylgeranyl pyrophosphate synthase
MTIKEKINNFKELFNKDFEKEIKDILKEQRDFHPATTKLDDPLKSIVLSYTKGGKRIRPFLIHFFAENYDEEKLMNLCIASELFHLAALIHDDIMDESEVRRGSPTMHIATQQFSHENNHLGTDIALLLGDVFLAASMAKAALLPPKVFEEFRKMIQRTIRGQYLDSFGMNQPLGETPRSEILARHELKTAWYTFTSPARLGYMNSKEYSDECMEVLTPVMQELGLLFQIRDDIIDCIDENSGKALFGDIMENQTTWVTLYIKENYHEKFKEIVSAKHNGNKGLLKLIFEEIDLHSPYEIEFNKRKEIVENIPEEFAATKDKARLVLELLKLN